MQTVAKYQNPKVCKLQRRLGRVQK